MILKLIELPKNSPEVLRSSVPGGGLQRWWLLSSEAASCKEVVATVSGQSTVHGSRAVHGDIRRRRRWCSVALAAGNGLLEIVAAPKSMGKEGGSREASFIR